MRDARHLAPGVGKHGLFPFAGNGSRGSLWFCGGLLASLVLYLGVSRLVRKPYSIGIYEPLIGAKKKHFRESASPRLIVIAGSNGRISHQAKLLEEMLGIPCTNGGLTADLSIDFLIRTYGPLLREGDFVYLPLEYHSLVSQGRTTKTEYLYLSSYGRETADSYPPVERVRIAFCRDLGDFFAEPTEVLAARSQALANRRSRMNQWGDQVGYDLEKAMRFREKLLKSPPKPIPNAEALSESLPQMKRLAEFLDNCASRGITVVGGLPTTFEDRDLDERMVEKLAAFYRSHGQNFVVLSNRSQYPRKMFFDSQYHLIDTEAERHTRRIGGELKSLVEARLKSF